MDALLRPFGDKMLPHLRKFLVFLTLLPLLATGLLAEEQEGKIAPKPLFRDPVYDGAADPVVVWNRSADNWRMFYTNRRANVPELSGVAWVHGTAIGMADSNDGGAAWTYQGTAKIDDGTGISPITHWAPEVIDDGEKYHMFLTVVPGIFEDWRHPRFIVHLTSSDLETWSNPQPLELASDRVIDACVLRLPDGRWRMWYNNERDHKSIYVADSADLKNWELKDKAVGDQGGEGPKVFRWQGRYWMITDVWRGLAVYRSDDLEHWERQTNNLLQEPGTGVDDQVIGGHPDVVVCGERAYLFYFTHPERRGPNAKSGGLEQRRSSLQVVELKQEKGWLSCDRNEKTRIRLNQKPDTRINRHALVTRHNPRLRSFQELIFSDQKEQGSPHSPNASTRHAPLQVGNGEFAFSADITGLQTFIPCNTLSHWGWHSEPLPQGLRIEDYRWTDFDTDAGRKVPFPFVGLAQDAQYQGSQVTQSKEQKLLAEWLRANPHRLNLGKLSLGITLSNGRPFSPSDLKDIDQKLDLWTGLLTSRFTVEGIPVQVATLCHPKLDAVAVRIESPLVSQGRLHVSLGFPYGDNRGYTSEVGDWSKPEAHESVLNKVSETESVISRRLDSDAYWVKLSLSEKAVLEQKDKHVFVLRPSPEAGELSFVCAFSPREPGTDKLPGFELVRESSRRAWSEFWHNGAAVDFSGSTDPRAKELERRVILSQYLMAIQEAGSLPSQEAGLVNNGWYGKFHLEMFWWHAAHQALWNRWPLIEKSLGFYKQHIPAARAIAEKQGYAGLRWPKMTGPDGRQSPSSISPFLIWQQPHPLFFAELDYRRNPSRETLEAWWPVLEGTLEFMCALPVRDAKTGRLNLGAPLKTVPENTQAEKTRNPSFELAYWRFGLRIGQSWRERLGLARDPALDSVLEQLAPLSQQNGVYLASETQPDTYENYNWEHPSLIGMFGWLPGDDADRETTRRTLDAVLSKWNMKRVWGWDFPMLALCAARLGQPERAVDMLLTESPNFQFAHNGFATGGPWPYFPSNGGLLYAVGFMAGGWDGAPERTAPGFPASPNWRVQCEGFVKAP